MRSHGDMLYLIGQELATTSMEESPVESIKEDEIDKYIEQQDGWIPRNRDPRLYVHSRLFTINVVVANMLPMEDASFVCPYRYVDSVCII